MRLRNLVLAVVFTLLAVGLVIAQRPAQNVSAQRHPNLAAAQKLIEQAYTRVTDAQKANEFDMQGHAAKAKDLLDQADKEIKAAAEAANQH